MACRFVLNSFRQYSVKKLFEPINPKGSSGSKMRFVQYLLKNDKCKRLGVISDDGNSIGELPSAESYSNDMIEFIKQNQKADKLDVDLNQVKFEPLNDNVKLLPPVTNPSKILCIGLNYRDHCLEQNKEPPKEPMFFSKFNNTLVGANENVIAHKITKRMDWEVELVVVIGKEAKNVKCEDAMNYVFGYTVAQDISARDWQKTRNGGQFLIGKSMDTFCPLGPAIVHKSLIPDIYNLKMTTHINGVQKQCGNTGDLIHRIESVIERLTQCITLLPGDIILTGTPAGVGMYREPPEYLQPGDVIDSYIELLGSLKNNVVEDK